MNEQEGQLLKRVLCGEKIQVNQTETYDGKAYTTLLTKDAMIADTNGILAVTPHGRYYYARNKEAMMKRMSMNMRVGGGEVLE